MTSEVRQTFPRRSMADHYWQDRVEDRNGLWGGGVLIALALIALGFW